MSGQHGFARNQDWNIEKLGPDIAVCRLTHNDATLAVWPHRFSLTYTVKVVQGQLMTSFEVENHNEAGDNNFDFTMLLHTYFNIGGIESVRVKGLEGIKYRDKLLGGQVSVEDCPNIKIEGEVDRAYIQTPNKLTLSSAMGKVEIHKEGLPDAVLWNPWIGKSKSMTDFEDEEVSN